MLNVVNFGGGSYVLYAEIARRRHDRGRPRALLRQLRPPGAAAAGRGQGAHRRDRPDRRPPARGLARAPRARRSSPRSAPTRSSRACRSPRAGGDDSRDRPRRLAGDRRPPPAASSSTTRPTRTSSPSATVEPYALINGREGWYVASLRPGARTTCATSASTASRRAEVLDERFEPRPEVDPAADVEGWPRTGEVDGLAHRARLDLARARALGARGAHASPQELADGALIVELSFAGDDWLVREVLKEAGDAVVLEPADAREAVARGRAPPARRASPSRASRVSRRDAIQHDRRRGRAPSSTSSARDLRDERPRRLAAPDAALVRRARRRAVGVDVREVPEGPQPRARPARDAAGRGRRRVRRAARRDVRDATSTIHRDARRRRPRSGWSSSTRYAGGGAGDDGRDARWSRAGAPSASRCSSSSATRVTWDHRKLGGAY